MGFTFINLIPFIHRIKSILFTRIVDRRSRPNSTEIPDTTNKTGLSNRFNAIEQIDLVCTPGRLPVVWGLQIQHYAADCTGAGIVVSSR